MSPPVEPGEFFAKLEDTGEDLVRTRFATGSVYGEEKTPLVEEWLRRKDQERKDSRDREAASSARDAADSAQDTAREARIANRISITAIIIAIVSLIVALWN